MSLYMHISSYQYTIHNVQEITQSGREQIFLIIKHLTKQKSHKHLLKTITVLCIHIHTFSIPPYELLH